MSNDSYFANIGGWWNEMARPSVHAGAQSRRNVEAEVDRLFDRLLSGVSSAPSGRSGGDEDDDRAAQHEAGHAFALWKLGHELGEVSIDEHGGGGTARVGGPAWTSADAVAVLLAGEIAERAVYDEAVDGGCDDDRALIDELLATGPPDLLAQARSDVARLLTGGGAAIRALAAVLARQRRVSGATAAAILAEHSAGRTEERSAGPVEITVHGHRTNPATGAWEPYTTRQQVNWPAAKAAAWNAMYAAGDRGDWDEFHRHQDLLGQFADRHRR